MPITEFQRAVLLLLRANRNPNSYVAGGIAIHRAAKSARHSNDIDFFHDSAEAVQAGASADLAVLEQNRYGIEMLIEQPSFVRAVITRAGNSLKLEWVRDTAFRFFPTIEDEDLGYRLHDIDLAANKCLALANRNEVRDIIDLIQLNHSILSFPATCWAACGKDPGFTPELLLDCIRRHSVIRSEQLAAESLEIPIEPAKLKQDWLRIMEPTSDLLKKFPCADLGCVYLDAKGEAVHSPNPGEVSTYHRHFGSISGSWPRLAA